MKSQICLSPRELLYIAAQLEAAEFIGISDAFYGMDDAEILQEQAVLQATLEQKGYARQNFDGGASLCDDVLDTVDICANCDAFIIVDKNKTTQPQRREFYYTKAGCIVKMKSTGDTYILTPISDIDCLLRDILQGIEWLHQPDPTLKATQIANAVLANVKESISEAIASNSVNTLLESGCNAVSAQAIYDGLSGKSNYYAVIVTVFGGTNEGVYSAMFIDAQSGILKLTPSIVDGTETVRFDPLDAEQAERVIRETLQNVFPRESEEFA